MFITDAADVMRNYIRPGCVEPRDHWVTSRRVGDRGSSEAVSAHTPIESSADATLDRAARNGPPSEGAREESDGRTLIYT